MMSISMVSRDRRFFEGIESVLTENKIKTDWKSTGAKALIQALTTPADLIIIDENLPDMTGRQFIEKITMQNPMINCVVASSLTKKEFHKIYEGFGILMQFPTDPGPKEAGKLLEQMNHILGLHTQKDKTTTKPLKGENR